jgi:hypothetical protein
LTFGVTMIVTAAVVSVTVVTVGMDLPRIQRQCFTHLFSRVDLVKIVGQLFVRRHLLDVIENVSGTIAHGNVYLSKAGVVKTTAEPEGGIVQIE